MSFMSITNHKVWIVLFLLLLLSLVAGATLLAIRCASHRPQEIIITSPNHPAANGQVFIGGAVANPGYYPSRGYESIVTALDSAAPTEQADLSRINVYIPSLDEEYRSQRIDINRAEAWLLQALPGIGPGRAQAIIAYRELHGPFSTTKDLLAIEGIGISTLEEIEDLITVED